MGWFLGGFWGVGGGGGGVGGWGGGVGGGGGLWGWGGFGHFKMIMRGQGPNLYASGSGKRMEWGKGIREKGITEATARKYGV